MLAAFAATLSFVQPSISSAAARHTCCRGGCVRSIEWPPAGIVITVLSGVAIFARPESPLWDLIQPEAAVVRVPAISSLCRDDGWELRLSIGRDMAQSVDVALQVRFERDGRFGEYPQGTAALRRPSKFFPHRAPSVLHLISAPQSCTSVLHHLFPTPQSRCLSTLQVLRARPRRRGKGPARTPVE